MVRNDDNAWLIRPKNMLYQLEKKLSLLLPGLETLFIIDDIFADKSLDKLRKSLLELAITGRHHNRKHYLWLLHGYIVTQFYVDIPKNIRR